MAREASPQREQAVHIGDVAEDGVDGLNVRGMRGVDDALTGVERLATRGSLHHAEVGGVIFEADSEGGDSVGRGCDGEGILDAESGLKNRHEPDGTGDFVLLRNARDRFVDFLHLGSRFDLGNQDEVGRLRDDLFQVGQPQRQLVDAHHALGACEIHGAKSVANQQAGGIFLGVVDRVFEVEDDGVGRVQTCIDEVLRLVAGQIEARAAETIFRRSSRKW